MKRPVALCEKLQRNFMMYSLLVAVTSLLYVRSFYHLIGHCKRKPILSGPFAYGPEATKAQHRNEGLTIRSCFLS